MTAVNETNSLEIRLSALEIRMSAAEALLNNLAGASPKASNRPSKKRSSAEKEKIKAELLKGVPYEKKGLDNLKSAELRMLASAVKVNPFGMKRDEIMKGILAAQKKK